MESVLDVEVSCFADYYSPDTPRPVNLLRWLGSAKYRAEVEQIRAAPTKEQRDALKAKLPAITPSGLFTRREASALTQHSGLICLDIDYKDENTRIGNFADLKAQLSRIRNVAYCGLSVSGTGFFVLIPLAHPEQHLAQFLALQQDFAQRGITVDRSCKDVCRYRGYSFDDAPYFNHQAALYTKRYRPGGPVAPVPAPPQRSASTPISHNDEETHLLNRCVKMVAQAGDGGRHDALLKAARLAGGFVAAGRLDEATATCALETIASEWPMFTKSQNTIRDGIRYGLAQPIYPDALVENAYTTTRQNRQNPARPVVAGAPQTLGAEPTPGIDYPASWG